MSTEANPSFEQRVQDRQDAVEAWVRRNITKGSWARIIRMARKPSPENSAARPSFADWPDGAGRHRFSSCP
ncbi:MAG: hypothetical protein CM15mP128_4530 [Methanobacteriota archaeon]|nr:MAG: hypothetical protein CM15mP128_4530 [Euryarchaeota archaeon]